MRRLGALWGICFVMSARDLLDDNLAAAEPLGHVAALARTYFENGPITLNANPKKMTNETATFNFLTFATGNDLLAKHFLGAGAPR